VKVLVLDDSRKEQFAQRLSSVGFNNVTYVATSSECIVVLAAQQYDLIFLDYDLTYMDVDQPSSDNTGAVVARWLSEHRMNPNHNAHIVIHSVDPYGSQYMKEFLPQAIMVPGAWFEDQFTALMKQLDLETS
jgi:CheY-like chemotaxis protein